METQKYDISKSFKLSSENIANIVFLQNEKGFKSDSEVVRFALNLATALVKQNLETKAVSSILENIANNKNKWKENNRLFLKVPLLLLYWFLKIFFMLFRGLLKITLKKG